MEENRFPIKGIRTDCVTGVESVVELEYGIQPSHDLHLGRAIFKLYGGPTGYESFYIDDDVIQDYRFAGTEKDGWIANFGTRNRWDKLVIPMVEMKKALAEFLK